MAGTISEGLAEARNKNLGTFDVMIDIETFGPPPRGALASVGLVRFNRFTGEIGRSVHLAIQLRTACAVGMKINPDTAVWWASQHADAGRALLRGAEPIHTQLAVLKLYFTPQDTVWAMPAAFDLQILRKAFDLCKIEVPWKESQEQCLSKFFKTTKKKTGYVTEVERHGTHHNAEDDAYTQALKLIDVTAHT